MEILYFKIINELKKLDYEVLCDFLDENIDAVIKLLPRIDFEFLVVQPLTLTYNTAGYLISTEVIFQQPIGLDIYEGLRVDDKVQHCIKVNYRNIKISVGVQKNSLKNNFDKITNFLERLVNYTAEFLNKPIKKSIRIKAELLNQQLEKIIREKELQKRGEIPQPYTIIHAKSGKDAKERAGDLVPLYLGRDKAYLYEDKNLYILLPRDFAKKLLKLDSSAMLPGDSFNKKEKAILKELSLRKYIEKRKIRGKTYYSDLDEKTRRILIKELRKKTIDQGESEPRYGP